MAQYLSYGFQPLDKNDIACFTDEEYTILVEQAEANLKPGEEAPMFEIWRCAHCREIKPWRDGGDTWTGPGVFCPEERDFLGACCDNCWHTIVKAYAAIFKKKLL